MADARAYVATKPTTLSASVTSTALSISVNEIKDREDNTLTMTDFGTEGYGVFEPGSTNEEHFTFSAISGTTITVARGVNMRAPYAASGTGKAHAAGTKVVIYSNTPALLDSFANKENDETITQLWTFTSSNIPRLDSFVNPTADEEFAPKKYVDDTAGGGPININRVIPVATAGATIAAGELCYQDPADGEWKLVDADTAATVDDVLIGIAQGAGTDGNPITGGILLFGLDSNQSGLTAGDELFASNTPGAIATTPGTLTLSVGVAFSATEIYVEPRYQEIPTGKQNEALDGSSGDPRSANPYITENDTSNAATITATTISFADANPDTISDSANGFVTAGFRAGQTITVSGSASNNGTFTIESVAAGVITLIAADTLVAEAAGATVTIVAATANKVVRAGATQIDEDFLQMTDADATTLTDGSNADSLHVHGFSERVNTDTSDVTVSNTTTETDLTTFTLAANTLNTANAVHLRLICSAFARTSGTVIVRLKYGATTVASATLSNFIPTMDQCIIEADLIAAGATNSQEGTVLLNSFDSDGATISSSTVQNSMGSGTAAEDSTTGLTLAVSIEFSIANAGNNITYAHGYSEVIRT